MALRVSRGGTDPELGVDRQWGAVGRQGEERSGSPQKLKDSNSQHDKSQCYRIRLRS